MTKQVFVCKISEGGDELFGGREGTQHHSSVSQKKGFFYLCLFLKAEQELTLVCCPLQRSLTHDGIKKKKQYRGEH